MLLNSGLDSRTARRVQASAGVPPTEECMRPTGTFKALRKSRPKKYATAEHLGVVSGPASCQRPFTSRTGWSDAARGTVKRRNCGSLELAIFSGALALDATDISMLDWPLASHTSPTS